MCCTLSSTCRRTHTQLSPRCLNLSPQSEERNGHFTRLSLDSNGALLLQPQLLDLRPASPASGHHGADAALLGCGFRGKADVCDFETTRLAIPPLDVNVKNRGLVGLAGMASAEAAEAAACVCAGLDTGLAVGGEMGFPE